MPQNQCDGLVPIGLGPSGSKKWLCAEPAEGTRHLNGFAPAGLGPLWQPEEGSGFPERPCAEPADLQICGNQSFVIPGTPTNVSGSPC